MTRTVVLFLGVMWMAAGPSAAATTVFPASPQAASANASSDTLAQNTAPQNQSSAQSPAPQNSSTQNSSRQNPQPQNSPAPNATSGSQTSTSPNAPTKSSAPAHPVRHKKKPVSLDCTSAATPSTSTPSTSSAATSGGTSKAPSGADSAASPAPANCPPKKTIVPEGSTGEPSIELAGGPSSEQAAQRNTANQMLGTAEENLKKMDGRQLSANQKDVISQIRQFIDQSRTAVKAGELDRARTLAWKAQTLSEELVKPENQ